MKYDKKLGISIDKSNYPVSVVENDSFTQFFEAQLLGNYKPVENFNEACIFMFVLVTFFDLSYWMNSNCCINLQN